MRLVLAVVVTSALCLGVCLPGAARSTYALTVPTAYVLPAGSWHIHVSAAVLPAGAPSLLLAHGLVKGLQLGTSLSSLLEARPNAEAVLSVDLAEGWAVASPLRASFDLDTGLSLGGGVVLSASLANWLKLHFGGAFALYPDTAGTPYAALGAELAEELELVAEVKAWPLRGAAGALWRPAPYVELRLAGTGLPLTMWGALTVRF